MSRVTELLAAARLGDQKVVAELFELLYQDLRTLAHAKLRRGPLTLLDTTALVHESYLRLFNSGTLAAKDKAHFMGYAAHVMRNIVIDAIRRRMADSRGGGAAHVELDEAHGVADEAREREVLQVHEALEELAKVDGDLVRVVEMRYFAGMTEPEMAEALDRSERSISRDWQKARAFLATVMT